MATVTANGTTFETIEQGSGDPVVCVHGSASDHRTWQGQRDAFAEHFRFLAYSRRYHWPNEPIAPGQRYGMEQHVDDLGAVLQALDAAPAHLVGHSYGGVLCLLLAVRMPDLVRSLVLAEPPAVGLFVSMPPKPLEILTLALRRPRTAVAIVDLGARGLAPAAAAGERGDEDEMMRLLGRATLGPEAFAALSEARAAQVRDNLVLEELVHPEAFSPLDANRLREVHRPVLLVGGDRSPRVFPRLLDSLETLLPRVERIVIRGASHLMHEDDPAAYNEAVLSFLTKRV